MALPDVIETNATFSIEPSQPAPTPTQDPAPETEAVVEGDVEAAKVDPPAEEAKPEAVKEDDKKPEEEAHSKRFELLKKKDRELLQREQALKEREKKLAELDRLDKLKLEDKLAWLKENGLSYDEITEEILKGDAGKTDSAVKKLEQQIAQMQREAKEKEENAKKQLEESEKNRKIQDYKRSSREHLAKEQEKYPLINALGEFDSVFDLQVSEFETKKVDLSVDDAAKRVEEVLAAQLKKIPPAVLKKFYPELGASTPEKPQKTALEGLHKETSTLTNDMSQTVTDEDDPDSLSDEESRARAARLIRFV